MHPALPGDTCLVEPATSFAPEAPEEFVAPPLEGQHVQLRPVTPSDYALLQTLELSPDLNPRWRFRGSTPSPEQWSQTLWRGVLAQYLVMRPGQSLPVGLVLAYNPAFQDQYAYLAAARFGATQRSPVMMLGLGLFVNYVFTCWPFRKLYMESPEYSFAEFASGAGRFFEVEGRLREHSFFGGRYWDQLTLAIYRERWTELGGRLAAAEAPTRLEPQPTRVAAPAGAPQ